jgi:hypothetical protein
MKVAFVILTVKQVSYNHQKVQKICVEWIAFEKNFVHGKFAAVRLAELVKLTWVFSKLQILFQAAMNLLLVGANHM